MGWTPDGAGFFEAGRPEMPLHGLRFHAANQTGTIRRVKVKHEALPGRLIKMHDTDRVGWKKHTAAPCRGGKRPAHSSLPRRQKAEACRAEKGRTPERKTTPGQMRSKSDGNGKP